MATSIETATVKIKMEKLFSLNLYKGEHDTNVKLWFNTYKPWYIEWICIEPIVIQVVANHSIEPVPTVAGQQKTIN